MSDDYVYRQNEDRISLHHGPLRHGSSMVGSREAGFFQLCRMPGSRCNAIMTDIEHGLSDKEIAVKYHTDTETARVYRKALNGELPEGRDEPANGGRRPGEEEPELYRQVIQMRCDGYGKKEICDELHIRWAKVEKFIEMYAAETNRSGKHINWKKEECQI